MFEQYMNYKLTEGLAEPTILIYYENFRYLTDFFDGDLSNEDLSKKQPPIMIESLNRQCYLTNQCHPHYRGE